MNGDILELLTEQHRHIELLLERARIGVEGRGAIVDELVDYVSAHLAVEQELFYPVITLSACVRQDLVLEHAEIRRALADLLWLDDSDPLFAPTLTRLADLFEGHNAWQDQELFAGLAEDMTPGVRRELGMCAQDSFRSLHDVRRAA
jgi:hypothetical protein